MASANARGTTAPHDHIVNIVMGFWQSRALAVAAELELPDLLAAGAVPVDSLASRTRTDPSSLLRLMRALETIVCKRSAKNLGRRDSSESEGDVSDGIDRPGCNRPVVGARHQHRGDPCRSRAHLKISPGPMRNSPMRTCLGSGWVKAGIILAAAVACGVATAPSAVAKSKYPGDPGESWAQIAKLPNWQGIWQLDWEHNLKLLGLMVPTNDLTPRAKAYHTSFMAKQKFGEDVEPQTANCLPPGMPQIMTWPYPIEFLFNPGKVVMLIESMEQERTIYTDGRGHPPANTLSPTFQGHSIGHWDGKTLVIDTVGVLPSRGPGPHTGAGISTGVPHDKYMRIIERIRKVDNDHMLITRTIIDPPILKKPWTVTLPYVRVKGDLMEYECEEGNRDSATANGRAGERITGN